MDSKITYKLHRCTHNKRTCLTFWVDKPLGFLPQLSNIGVILGKVIIMIKKVDIRTIYNCRGLHIHIDTHTIIPSPAAAKQNLSTINTLHHA